MIKTLTVAWGIVWIFVLGLVFAYGHPEALADPVVLEQSASCVQPGMKRFALGGTPPAF